MWKDLKRTLDKVSLRCRHTTGKASAGAMGLGEAGGAGGGGGRHREEMGEMRESKADIASALLIR
jgi:hypothetical protein